MQKRLILALVMLLTCFGVRGQGSLIYHTSFEIDPENYCKHSSTTLPFDSTRLEYFYNDIFTSLNSVDIFSPCDTFTINGVPYWYANNIPVNYFGFQYPKDRMNYIGLFTTWDTINAFESRHYREWVGINPNYHFIQNKFYKVVFYVSVSENSGLFSTPPQVYFSSDSIYYSAPLGYVDFNTINNSTIAITDTLTIFSDTSNWVQVETIYKSNGEEKYIYLGNFLDYKHTKWEFRDDYIPKVHDPYPYFYIDDLSIYELDSTYVGVTENPANSISIYPNPAADNVTVNTGALHNTSVQLFNIQGRLLLQQNIVSTATTIDVSSFASGVYVVSVLQNGVVVKRNKVVVSR